MAIYKYISFLSQSDHEQFDLLYSPGARTPWSGIYRCHVCGKEVVHTHDQPLPPQNHHQHPNYAPIQWRLVVTDHG